MHAAVFYLGTLVHVHTNHTHYTFIHSRTQQVVSTDKCLWQCNSHTLIILSTNSHTCKLRLDPCNHTGRHVHMYTHSYMYRQRRKKITGNVLWCIRVSLGKKTEQLSWKSNMRGPARIGTKTNTTSNLCERCSRWDWVNLSLFADAKLTRLKSDEDWEEAINGSGHNTSLVR